MKISLAAILSLYGSFYSFFIVPYSSYFSHVREIITKERSLAVYVNDLCLTYKGYIDPTSQKEAYDFLKTFHLERANLLYEVLALTNDDYKLTNRMFDAIDKFDLWNWEQIQHTNNTQNCPQNLKRWQELREEEKEITQLFPNSNWDYLMFFLEK